MLAEPLGKLEVGVKTAVRVRPVPLMVLNVPPLTAMSPAKPFHEKLLPGSSENVNEILAVSPALSEDRLLAMLTLGDKVSMLMLGLVPPLPVLPALSA